MNYEPPKDYDETEYMYTHEEEGRVATTMYWILVGIIVVGLFIYALS